MVRVARRSYPTLLDSCASCAGVAAEAVLMVLDDTAALVAANKQGAPDPDYALKQLTEWNEAITLYGIN